MRLALDLPTALLAECSPLADLDYAVASRVLSDDAYAAFYAGQARSGREIILDNPATADGPPLSLPEVSQAVLRVVPTFVLAKADTDPVQALLAFRALSHAVSGHTGVGVTLCGATQTERTHLFLAVHKEAAMLCLPGTEQGVTWLEELWDVCRMTIWPPYLHFINVGDYLVMEHFRDVCEDLGLPRRRISTHIDMLGWEPSDAPRAIAIFRTHI